MRPYVFFTFVSDDYYTPVGTPGLINSFKHFHPDIPLVIFRQDVVNEVIFKGSPVNWLNAKPVFAKFLTNKFECVVNIDADTIITGRLDEVFTDDYDIGSVMNLNDFENRHFKSITDEMYLQAGLVASRKPEFWDIWMQDSLKNNWQYKCAENDSLNVVVYEQLIPKGWKLKVFDKEKDYYGCKALNRESEMYLQGDQLKLRGEDVKAYHAAKGPGNMPKFQWEKLGFNSQVTQHLQALANYGQSVIYDQL